MYAYNWGCRVPIKLLLYFSCTGIRTLLNQCNAHREWGIIDLCNNRVGEMQAKHTQKAPGKCQNRDSVAGCQHPLNDSLCFFQANSINILCISCKNEPFKGNTYKIACIFGHIFFFFFARGVSIPKSRFWIEYRIESNGRIRNLISENVTQICKCLQILCKKECSCTCPRGYSHYVTRMWLAISNLRAYELRCIINSSVIKGNTKLALTALVTTQFVHECLDNMFYW